MRAPNIGFTHLYYYYYYHYYSQHHIPLLSHWARALSYKHAPTRLSAESQLNMFVRTDDGINMLTVLLVSLGGDGWRGRATVVNCLCESSRDLLALFALRRVSDVYRALRKPQYIQSWLRVTHGEEHDCVDGRTSLL